MSAGRRLVSGALPQNLGVNALFFVPGAVGGMQTALVETLLRLVPALPGACTIFTNRENDAFLRRIFDVDACPRGVAFEKLDFRARDFVSRTFHEQFALPGRIATAGCDAVWSPGSTACLRAKCPQVVTVHDMRWLEHPEDASPLERVATDWVVARGVAKCARVLAPSHFIKSEIVDRTMCDPRKVSVVPNGVSPGFSAAEPAGLDRPYILCVAGSHPHKNLPSLVAAFDTMAVVFPHKLVIVGERGRDEENLQAEILASRHADRVERLVNVDPARLQSLYAGASLFVLPSLYEGFGLPVVEAQAAGVPVLAATSASLPEVCGEGAILFDPVSDGILADAMRAALLMNGAARDELVARGRANAARFTWEATARQVLDAVSRAMEQ